MKKLIENLKEGDHLLQMAGLFAAILFLLAGSAWRLYVSIFDLGPGGVGSEALEDTPAARSLADMETLERFTFLERHTPEFEREGVWLEDTYYTILTLDSGERVACIFNYNNAVLRDWVSEGNYTYCYPIGTWRSWKLNEAAQAELERLDLHLASTNGYADMAGRHLTALTQGQFQARYRMICLAAALVFMIVYGVRRQTRKERRAAEAAKSSQPRNDLERWLVGTYAIWGQFFAQVSTAEGRMAWNDEIENGPLHFGGRPMDEPSQKLTRGVLLDSWDIKNQQDLLETVEYMSAGPGLQNCEDQAGRAWELCRSIQLLGMSYIAGWCDREEMLRRSCTVGKIIQSTFRSWEELCESFLEGYARWQRRSNPQQAQANIQVRREIYEKLRLRPDSPYLVNWYLPLDPDAWARREKQRRVLEGDVK